MSDNIISESNARPRIIMHCWICIPAHTCSSPTYHCIVLPIQTGLLVRFKKIWILVFFTYKRTKRDCIYEIQTHSHACTHTQCIYIDTVTLTSTGEPIPSVSRFTVTLVGAQSVDTGSVGITVRLVCVTLIVV